MIQALEGVDRLRRRLVNIDQPLVSADLEVLTAVLVLERRANHAVDVLLRGQRDRAGDGRTGARGGLDDLLGSRLDRRVVIGLQANPDLVLGDGRHKKFAPRGVPPRVLMRLFGLRPLLTFFSVKRGRPRAIGARPKRSYLFKKAALGGWESQSPAPPNNNYWTTSVTIPEPTVRPPSRIANRSP